MTRILTIALVSSLLTISAQAQCPSSCQTDKMPIALRSGPADIVDTAIAAGQFKTLATALTTAELVETLKGKGPFTVFAPTDAAFEKLPDGTVAGLLKPKARATLTSILTFHVVAGRVPASQVVKTSAFMSLNGQRLPVSVSEGTVTVAGANVVKTDIPCSNGIIHVIDSVMMPATKNIVETAQGAGSFNTLLTAAKAAGLAGVLSDGGPFTVFAPTDDAFAALPEGTVASLLRPENRDKLAAILKYHVVSGRAYAADVLKSGSAKTLQGGTLPISSNDWGAKVAGAKILKTDIEASNGVIHVIGSVLLPN